MRKFHYSSEGGLSVEQIVLAAVVATTAFLAFPMLQQFFRWFQENSAIIWHCIAAAVICFGGTYCTCHVSRNSQESWNWAQLWMLAAILYLVVFLGLPMVQEFIESKLDGLLQLR